MQAATDAIGFVQLVFAVGTPVATVAAAYFALKYGLNGTRKAIQDTCTDVGDIKGSLNDLKEGQTDVRIKIAEIGTGLHDTRGWVGKVEERLNRHIEMDP